MPHGSLTYSTASVSVVREVTASWITALTGRSGQCLAYRSPSTIGPSGRWAPPKLRVAEKHSRQDNTKPPCRQAPPPRTINLMSRRQLICNSNELYDAYTGENGYFEEIMNSFNVIE
ncbi:hypothetical protein [Paenibacillus marchantiophytorum]|uniref:hypothetical protein n=1 Tax=Paenibacillus marchantiophytorum TaxID=1619310 RepID=UPI00188D69C0|nr:hypothetical protein [Paenibacillus marchantiophytorum]